LRFLDAFQASVKPLAPALAALCAEFRRDFAATISNAGFASFVHFVSPLGGTFTRPVFIGKLCELFPAERAERLALPARRLAR
jgi:hypothetical protein